MSIEGRPPVIKNADMERTAQQDALAFTKVRQNLRTLLSTAHTPPSSTHNNTLLKKLTLIRINNNEQLLDCPFTRLLLEALRLKTSNYLQVKGIDR